MHAAKQAAISFVTILSKKLQDDMLGFADDSSIPDRLKVIEMLLRHGAKPQAVSCKKAKS